MRPETIFSLANLVALAVWVVLVALPRQRRAVDVAVTGAAALFAAVYFALIASQWTHSSGSFSTLSGVASLFGNPSLLLAGWLHYLAFDMLVGRWETIDAGERGIPHLAVVPCLLLTFMFGPAGWLAYMAVRTAYGRRTASRVTSSRAARAPSL
jgi:hypothetical protein